MNLFGAGFLVGRPAATAANPNPTPRKFGQLQEVSFDSTYTTKELMGAMQHPLREFRGAAKTELKAKFAKINGRQFAEIFWGIAPASETAGSIIPAMGTDGVLTVPSVLSGPLATFALGSGGTSGYTTAASLPTTTNGGGSGATLSITAVAGLVTAATLVNAGVAYAVGDKVFPTQVGGVGAAYFTVSTITGGAYNLVAPSAGVAGVNFVEDYGVEYVSTGAQLKLVASAPTQGQYSLIGGIYTFAAADSAAQVVLNYSYNNSAAGFTFSIPNTVQAESPYFETILTNPQDGGFVRRIYRCSASKIAQNFKQGDIMIPELDVKVYDPGTGIMWQDSYAAE